jgi:hypothetical protein
MTRAGIAIILATGLSFWGGIYLFAASDTAFALTVCTLCIVFGLALILAGRTPCDDDIHYPMALDAGEPEEKSMRAKGGAR